MDTLALLCNLHADGPATLQRLRRAGCESLLALRRFEPASLAQHLDWNERTAERFLREAALLIERVEAEEDNDCENELESSLVEELDGGEAESESEEDSAEEPAGEEDPVGYAPPVERMEAVLGAWRELDRVAPPDSPQEFVIPRPAPAPDLELGAARLEGLTPHVASRLAELGVSSLRQLVSAEEFSLARHIPMAYTRLCRLRFLAGRALEGLSSAVGEPAPTFDQGFRPFTPLPNEPFETAGPFAM